MNEDDIRSLAGQEPDRSLDTLEADVWAGVAARQAADRISRLVLSCQAFVVAAALVSSLIAGSQIGHALAKETGQQSSFANGMELAPSTLLLGHPT
jgi:hypothetical protein